MEIKSNPLIKRHNEQINRIIYINNKKLLDEIYILEKLYKKSKYKNKRRRKK